MPHFFAAAYLVSAAPLAGKDKSAGYHCSQAAAGKDRRHEVNLAERNEKC